MTIFQALGTGAHAKLRGLYGYPWKGARWFRCIWFHWNRRRPSPLLCVRKVVFMTNLALVYTPMWGGHTPIEGWFQGVFQGGSSVVPGGSSPFPRLSAQAPMQYYVGFISSPGKAPGGSTATDTPFYIIKRENRAPPCACTCEAQRSHP